MTTPQVQSGSLIVATSDVLSTGNASAEHLTADGLMLYIQSRLTSIDGQIETLFEKQKHIESLRKVLTKLQNAIAAVGEEGGKLTAETKTALNEAMAELKALDKGMHDNLKKDFDNAGLIKDNGWFVDEFKPEHISAFNASVGSRIKELESSAQLDMLWLQQLMGQRGSALQLCTNMISACGKPEEAIVANIGR